MQLSKHRVASNISATTFVASSLRLYTLAFNFHLSFFCY